MSAQSNRTDYIILGILALVSVAVCYHVATREASNVSLRQPPYPTSLSTHSKGAMACYMLYERLGVQVSRSFDPLGRERLADVDVLFIVDPILSLHPTEHQTVTEWVRGGGLLICTPDVLSDVHHVEQSFTAYDFDEEETVSGCSGPLARDVEAVSAGDHALDDQGLMEDSRALRTLLADEEGIRIAERPLGAGRIVVVADAAFLSNWHLDEADNAVLAANLVAYSLAAAKGRRVAFDEYHFGIGHESSWWLMSRMLAQTSPGWAVLCLAVAATAYLVLKGRRFGIRRDERGRRRRSKLEFVTNVAGTFRAARANGLTLQILLKWFYRRCTARVGLPATAEPGQLAAALEHIGRRSKDEYIAVFAQCTAASKQRLSTRRFNTLLRLLTELESEITDGHPQSR